MAGTLEGLWGFGLGGKKILAGHFVKGNTKYTTLNFQQLSIYCG